jgi:hypothetical protein
MFLACRGQRANRKHVEIAKVGGGVHAKTDVTDIAAADDRRRIVSNHSYAPAALHRPADVRDGSLPDMPALSCDVRFSNRPLGVKRFQALHLLRCRCRSRARASLRNRHQGPSIMGSEDEVERSKGRPCRRFEGRSKRTCELTSSIVPRGTSFHRVVELEFPPVGFDPVSSCRCGFSGPSEFGAINPDAVHDHGQATGQGDNRLFDPAPFGNLHCPGLEPGPLR